MSTKLGVVGIWLTEVEVVDSVTVVVLLTVEVVVLVVVTVVVKVVE